MLEKTYEVGHRYGDSETVSSSEVLYVIDKLIAEFNDVNSAIVDEEHRQVYVLDQDGDAFTVYLDGYILFEHVGSTGIESYYKEVQSIDEIKSRFELFILNKSALLKSIDWTKESEIRSNRNIFSSNKNKRDFSLHRAAFNGNLNEAKRLIAEGFEVNLQDDDGATPIMHAIVEDHIDIVKYLLDCGASTNIKDTDGSSVYDLAAGNKEILNLLAGT